MYDLTSITNVAFLASQPGSPIKGQVYFNTTSNALFFYNGTAWMQISTGGGVTVTTVEKNLGSMAKSGTFTITGSGLTAGQQVMISQASGPYTGKGTLADESQKDRVMANGYVVNSTTIRVYWMSDTWVKGNFKFNYFIQ